MIVRTLHKKLTLREVWELPRLGDAHPEKSGWRVVSVSGTIRSDGWDVVVKYGEVK